MKPASSDSERVFFSGLNELRAVAALFVLFAHIELDKFVDGYPTLYQGRFGYLVSHLGKNGVYLFFVLSGFLITFLLLTERARTGTIQLKAFWVRRALRIWPLYFTLVLLGFVLIPSFGSQPWFASVHPYYAGTLRGLSYGPNLALHLVFLSNLARMLYPPVLGLAQSWSVSVEEQFYLFWPMLLRAARRRPWLMLLGVIVAKLSLLRVISMVNHRIFAGKSFALRIAHSFLDELSFDLMAIGGLAAWLLFRHPGLVKRWASSRWALLVTGALIAAQLWTFSRPWLLGVSFAVLLLQVVTQQVAFRPLAFLGRISYGFYMYHPAAMFLCFAAVRHACGGRGVVAELLAYFSIFTLTLVVSMLSYRYLELPFLRWKERFAVVASGATTDPVTARPETRAS